MFWIIKMLEELKSMLIKKFSTIYIYVCLCGNHAKYKRIIGEIVINEENEILREKYHEQLRKLELLYSEGKLVLNKKTLEKVNLYLEDKKVLKAAGLEVNKLDQDEYEKLEKRKKR